MTMASELIRIGELSKLDVHELTLELGDVIERKEEEELTAEKAGEPVTIALTIALGALAIKGITLWLLKKRTSREVIFIYERQDAAGGFERKSATLRFSSSDPPTSEAIEAVGAALQADPTTIAEAVRLAGG